MDCLSQTYTKKISYTTGQILQAFSILRIWVTSLFIIFFIESIHTSVFLNDLLLCLCFALISHRSLFRDDGDGMAWGASSRCPSRPSFAFAIFLAEKNSTNFLFRVQQQFSTSLDYTHEVYSCQAVQFTEPHHYPHIVI